MEKILIYPCGINVCTRTGSLLGLITCSSIRFDKIQYEITYLNDGKFETVWMNENEFRSEGEKQYIGFK